MLVLLVACGMLVADRVNRFPMVGAFLGTHFGVLTFIALWVDPDLVREAYRPAAGQPVPCADPPARRGSDMASYQPEAWLL